MKDYVISVKVIYFSRGEENGKSNEKTLEFTINKKIFLYSSLYYEILDLKDDSISVAFYKEVRLDVRKPSKWIKYPEAITLNKINQEEKVAFKVNPNSVYVIYLKMRDATEYQKERHDEYVFNNLPLVEKLRIKGAKELKDKKLVFNVYTLEKDVYSEDSHESAHEFEVIEGNYCHVREGGGYGFTIEKIVDDTTILINGEKLKYGKEITFEKSTGGYTNDGPQYIYIKIIMKLVDR